jgi:hypothetical protein
MSTPSPPTAAPSTGDQLYSGMATIGRVRTTIGLVVAGLVAATLVLIGLFVFSRPATTNVRTQMTVTAVQGSAPIQGAPGVSQFQVLLGYSVGGAPQPPLPATVQSKSVAVGDLVWMFFDPSAGGVGSAPQQFQSSPKMAGGIIIVMGLLIGAVGWGLWYAAKKSKGFAALEGVMGVAGVADGMTNGLAGDLL